MDKRLSLYLDVVRFAAAFWVVLAHFRLWDYAPPAVAAWLPDTGRDAVILFFVLSGFVIAHTAGRKDGRTFAIDRAARIYSVAVPIVLAATAFALWGVASGADGYERFYQPHNIPLYLGVYFSFTGSFWFLQEVPFGIVPYWSLNFEVWYYVLFGVLFYLRGRLRIVVFGAVFLAVGFKLWLLWPVWLAGVWLYRHHDRWPMRPAVARAVMLATVVSYAAMEATGADRWLWMIGNAPFGGLEVSPLGDARFFLSDYVVGVLAAIHFYAARYADLRLPQWSARPIRWLAGLTFTLYLAHGPLLTFWGIHAGKGDGSIGTALLLFAGLLLAVVGIGYLTERRLNAWRQGIAWAVSRGERCLSTLRRRVATGSVLRLHR